MKNIINTLAGVAIAATLLVVAASCSHDDDGDNPLSTGNEARPTWAVPADLYTSFEYTMSVQLTLQDELLARATDDDLMCAVVDGEIRAVSPLQRTSGEVYFPLVIAGSSTSGKVTVRYYCSQLKRTYTVADWQPFSPGISPTQDGKPYVINFISMQR